MGKRQTAPNPEHEQQPLDETVAKGEHMDLDLNDEALAAERAAGAPAPTGVILASPSQSMNPNLSEEMQGMELIPKTFGPPQYGSPDPATAASRLMTLEDGHPLMGLPPDHPAAISEDYAVEYEEGQPFPDATAQAGLHSGAIQGDVDATDGAKELAEEKGIDLSTVKGSGDGGRISKSDVQKAVDERDSGDGGADRGEPVKEQPEQPEQEPVSDGDND